MSDFKQITIPRELINKAAKKGGKSAAMTPLVKFGIWCINKRHKRNMKALSREVSRTIRTAKIVRDMQRKMDSVAAEIRAAEGEGKA